MTKTAHKPRVTIDTNVVISAIISPKSTASRLLTSWTAGDFQWIVTEELVAEIKTVLGRERIRHKYHISEQDAASFLNNLAVATELVATQPLESLSLHARDPKDDIVLAAALSGESDYLITGHDDLLVLNGHAALGMLQIVKPADFLAGIR